MHDLRCTEENPFPLAPSRMEISKKLEKKEEVKQGEKKFTNDNDLNIVKSEKNKKLGFSYEKSELPLNTIKEKNSKNIKLAQEMKLDGPVYSMCFLEQNKYILMGLEKKIDLYDQKLKYISSFSQ